MNTPIPAGLRLVGSWYNGLGNGQYIRYQFTDAGAYAYSNPFKMASGTFALDGDRLTITDTEGRTDHFTIRFECIGTGTFAEYLTFRNDATHLETPCVRDPTDPRNGQFCG